MSNTTHTAATEYTDLGYNCIPIALDGSKRPAVTTWKPYQTQQTNSTERYQWFEQRRYGIGIVCGSVSGNLLVMDFDRDAEQSYPEWIQQVREQMPELADQLAVVKTPRPGYHVWLTCDDELPGPQVLAYTAPEPRVSATGEPETDADGSPILAPGVLVEIRSTGNYVIAPGSPPAVHPSGKLYTWHQNGPDSIPRVSSSQLDTLLNLARQLTRYTPEHVSKAETVGTQYQGEPRPGDVYNEQTDLLELLHQHGWQDHHTAGDVVHITRPGKRTSDGTSGTVGALRSPKGKPLLYVFSSAASPFNANQTYDAFAAYTLLEHQGDYSRAAGVVRVQLADRVQQAQKQWHSANSPQVREYQPFPVELLPEPVAQYVDAHTKAIGIDPAFIAVPMLSVLAALIGQARRVQIKKTWTEPSVLWTVTVADSSSGKTPGYMAATAPVLHIEEKLQRIRDHKHRQYLDNLAEWKQAKATNTDKGLPKPEPERFTDQIAVDDVTMETLTSIHSDNWKGLLLACDELNGWLSSFNLYRSGKGRDVENWLSLNTGGRILYNRKTDSSRIFIPSTAVSVCGGIQPAVAARTLYTPEFIANGLAARILSARPPSKVVRWTETEVPEETTQTMNTLAGKLWALRGTELSGAEQYIPLPFATDAKAEFIEYYQQSADAAEQMEPDQRNLSLKLRPAAARLALVFSVVQQVHTGTDATGPVDLPSIRAGIQLAQWFLLELERNYIAGMCEHKTNTLQAHAAWIKEHNPGGIDARTLQQYRRGLDSADAARLTLQQLAEQGYGRLSGDKFIPI